MKDKIKALLETALHLHTDMMTDDDYTKHSILDEISNSILHAMHTLDKLDKLEDTKQTREVVYLTTEYRYTEVEKRMFLVTHFASSLHELSEMHTYEVTVQRTIADSETYAVDYTHKAIIIADFDYNNCINKDFKNDFEDEILDAVFDCRFNALNASIKQLS